MSICFERPGRRRLRAPFRALFRAGPLFLLLAGLVPAAGCRQQSGLLPQSAAAAQAESDARDLALARELRARSGALTREFDGLRAAAGAVQARRARLRLRLEMRAGGIYHLVYLPAAGRLQLYRGSRPLGSFRLRAATANNAMPVLPPAPAVISDPSAPSGTSTPSAPTGLPFKLMRVQTLIPPEPPPKVPGRPATAGGNARLFFGDGGVELFYLSRAGAPAKPPPPPLPAYTIAAGEIDGLIKVLKSGAPLFVEEES